MVTCQSCGEEQPADNRFCESCGTPLSAACPTCGSSVHAGSRFCGSCGHPLTNAANPIQSQSSSPAAATPVAERRVCSVLFCDLVGFTSLSESRDAEQVRELLTRYFDAARTIVGRYGGVVEKFIGDAVMAVWGTPTATEDDPERAVRAALDIVAAVRQLGAEVGLDLGARAGVVTGEVAVTIGAVGQGMVAGDAVNTAARVQAAAEPGTVFADEATHDRSSRAIGFTPAGSHEMKGKAEPQELWVAQRVLSGVGGSQRVDGLEGPLVGRDAELRLIRELFHAAADRKMARMLLVSGPAGVGKSRLGWEFEKYVDGLAATVLWHRGRCLSYGDGVAFWALGEMFRQRLNIAEEEPTGVAAVKLIDGVATLFSDPAEADYVGQRVGRLLGLPFPGADAGDLAREELFAGWRLFIERMAVAAPVVLVVEDLQHADTALLDFVDYLIDWSRNLPIYVVAFARPELDRARPGFASGRNRTSLTLDPLDPASMDALVSALVPNMPAPDRAVVTERAEGLPLFAVETIRSLIDRDVVVPRDGVYLLVADIGELRVPRSLQALLAARLDALAPDVRQLVGDAAVLGSSFPVDALVVVSGRPSAEVTAMLRQLVEREVIEVFADPLSPERGQYRFAQGLLRQVAYDTLSRHDRRARHLAVAAHLEATFANDGEQVIDVVARHYHDALRAVPDAADAEAVTLLAVAAYIRAADRARRTGATVRAALNYSTAAELLTGLPGDPHVEGRGIADLWAAAGDAHRVAASWAAAVECVDRACEVYRAHGDEHGAARAHLIAGRALLTSGGLHEARQRLLTARATLASAPDETLAQVYIELGAVETHAGSPEAEAMTKEALALAQDLGVDSGVYARALLSRGIWLGVSGYRRQGVMYLREGCRTAEEMNDTGLLGHSLLNLADLLAVDDPPAAAAVAARAVTALRRTGNKGLLTYAVTNLANAHIEGGDWPAAASAMAQAMDEDGLGASEEVVSYQVWLDALVGRADEAEAALAGLQGLSANEDPQTVAQLEIDLGFIAAARSDHREALRQAQLCLGHIDALGISAEAGRWAWPLAARSALELGDLTTVRSLLSWLDHYPDGRLAPIQSAERQLVRARLAAADGNPLAAELFVAAIQRLRESSTPYHLAHGLLDHAAFLRGQPEGMAEAATAAEAAVAEAKLIGARLGCAPLLERVGHLAPTF